MTSVAPPPPLDESLREEVRVAMALNGGVSLAIWMGGCAVELDCARRAHLGPEPLEPATAGESGNVTTLSQFVKGRDPPAPQPPPVTRSLYHGLCDAFGRELVIDLMSGASAGGINGALLGCATAYKRRLHPDFLRNKWLTLGDLSHLLQRTSSPDPRSLMRGQMFHRALLRTFRALVDPSKATASDLALTQLPEDQAKELAAAQVVAPVPKLDITTTDLAGVERTYQDVWKERLVAREYRARFAFRDKDDYSAENLAAAARSSASFPFAFEPWLVTRGAGALAGFTDERWVIDGGVLDNAPIRAVLDLIPERPANRQVRRYVCYLNADPPLTDAQQQEEADVESSPPPGAPTMQQQEEEADNENPPPSGAPSLQQVAGNVLGLPRKAPFVDQLEAIERRTRQADFSRQNQLGLVGVAPDVLKAVACALLPTYRTRRRLNSLDEILDDPGAVRVANQRLDDQHDLPWVPVSVSLPAPTAWGWGLRAAQRAIHLLLDAVRAAIEDAQRTADLPRLKRLLRARAPSIGPPGARTTSCGAV